MNLLEIIEESISVLRTNKLRTALSALGIIIGIGSVITLMTLGAASQSQIQSQIQNLGSNLLTIRSGNRQQGFLRSANSGGTTLKNSDSKAILEDKRVTTISKIASDYSSRAQISYDRNNTNVQITGIQGDYFSIRNIQLEIGSEITESDNEALSKVVVLGPTVVTDLFGDQGTDDSINPLGKYIRINGQSYRVIGVTKAKGGVGGNNFDEAVYVPLITAQKGLFGVDYLNTIYAEAKSSDLMDAALNQIGFLLLERHKKVTPEEADFSIFSQAELLDTISSVTQTFTTLLAGIAAISLIVGGIGIMNIMLVSVTERTTEIGLRKALGAKRKTIITQFLVEAIILTITGGIIGVIMGLTTSYAITKLMSLPLVISYLSIGLAAGVSCLIGIVFGWYPAYKASKLQPIEALRYE